MYLSCELAHTKEEGIKKIGASNQMEIIVYCDPGTNGVVRTRCEEMGVIPRIMTKTEPCAVHCLCQRTRPCVVVYLHSVTDISILDKLSYIREKCDLVTTGESWMTTTNYARIIPLALFRTGAWKEEAIGRVLSVNKSFRFRPHATWVGATPSNFFVLSYCSGYGYHVFQRFAGTLYDTGFAGRLVFFTQGGDVSKIERLRREFPKREILSVVSPKRTGLHCQTSRFVDYYEWMRRRSFLPGARFLMCDSRDVIFQRNIESYAYEEGRFLYVALEASTIGKCHFNSQWLKCAEESMQLQVCSQARKRRVVCCGTIFGSEDGCMSYLEELYQFLYWTNGGGLRARLHKLGEFICPKAKGLIMDQGFLLYYCYRFPDPPTGIRFLDNKLDPLIDTVGGENREVDEGGNVINPRGEVPYVVHQWDRFPFEQKTKLSLKYDMT